MSLICVRSYSELNEKYKVYPGLLNPGHGKKGAISFSHAFDIQHAFCDRIEWEQSDNGDDSENSECAFQFLNNQEVQDYLRLFDIEYVGNFLFEGVWYPGGGEMSDEEQEQRKSREFVTFLNYPLQLACIALAEKKTFGLCDRRLRVCNGCKVSETGRGKKGYLLEGNARGCLGD